MTPSSGTLRYVDFSFCCCCYRSADGLMQAPEARACPYFALWHGIDSDVVPLLMDHGAANRGDVLLVVPLPDGAHAMVSRVVTGAVPSAERSWPALVELQRWSLAAVDMLCLRVPGAACIASMDAGPLPGPVFERLMSLLWDALHMSQLALQVRQAGGADALTADDVRAVAAWVMRRRDMHVKMKEIQRSGRLHEAAVAAAETRESSSGSSSPGSSATEELVDWCWAEVRRPEEDGEDDDDEDVLMPMLDPRTAAQAPECWAA